MEMSRQIDMSDPDSWSEADRQYLQDRNMLPADQINVGPAQVHPQMNVDGPIVPPAGTPNMDSEDDVLFDGKADEYDDMNVDELKNALRERGLAVSGTKNELVYRLRADDAQPMDDTEDVE
jgi:hypothetical protein